MHLRLTSTSSFVDHVIGTVIDTDTALYRTGGIAALLIGTAYVATVVLYASVGPPPSGGQASLEYFAGKTTAWWAILGLSVLTDLLFVPVALALYSALKDFGRNAMLVATAMVALFVVLDLAVTWSNYASLIVISGDFAAATTEAQRAADVAAATYASAVLASPLERVYAIVILSSGILAISVVMLKGNFGKITASLGMATGILGVVSLAGFAVTIIANAILATIWVFLVGYSLYRVTARTELRVPSVLPAHDDPPS